MEFFGYTILPDVPNEVLFLAVIVIIFIILWKKGVFKKKDEDEYKPIDLPKEITENAKETLKIRDKAVFKKKYFLYIGFDKVGRITQYCPFFWDDEEKDLKQSIRNERGRKLVEAVKGNPVDENYYLFEVIEDNFFALIKRAFGKGFRYFIVDKSLIDDFPTNNQFVIQSTAQYHRYYKSIWVFSEKGKKVVMNIADRIALEETTKALADFIPRMVFLETRTAKMILKAQELQKLEQQKYASRIEALEKE